MQIYLKMIETINFGFLDGCCVYIFNNRNIIFITYLYFSFIQLRNDLGEKPIVSKSTSVIAD